MTSATITSAMTDIQRQLSRKYLVYKACTNLWFLGAVWLYFYRLFITDQQIGVLDGMAFAIGLLAEVPSGALADKFGRDKIIRLGQVLMAGGLLIQAAGSSFMPLFVGQSILMVGISLISGADDALFFEKLKFKRTSHEWRKLVTRGSQVALLATLSATLLGGLLHTINPRLPWALSGIAFLIATWIIWPIKDTRTKASHESTLAEVKAYVHDIKTGFAQFKLPTLWPYVPLIIAVQGIFYASEYGLLRLVLLSGFSFNPFQSSVVVTVCGCITVGLLALMHRYADTIREKQILVFIALSTAVCLALAVLPIGKWGALLIFVLYAGSRTIEPFMSEILNYHAPENQRATVLSVASFLRTLPYVLLAPLIGTLSTGGKLDYFLLAWPMVIVVAIVLYLVARRRETLTPIA